MWNHTVSMATDYTILSNEGKHSKLIIYLSLYLAFVKSGRGPGPEPLHAW